MSVVVVGGGLAGLLSAYRLARSGVDVALREAAPHWGGMISPVEIAGVRVDAGAEAYATRGGLGHELCAELGLTVAAPEGQPHVWWPEGPFPIADGLLGIPGSADDPALAVLTVEERQRLLEDLTMGAAPGSDAHTIGELASARFGREAMLRLVGPVASGIYATPAEHLALAAVAPGILDAMAAEGSLIGAVSRLTTQRRSAVEQPVGGMFTLIDELVARLHDLGADLRAGAAVNSVRKSGGGIQVQLHDGEMLAAERVVVATQASVASRLLAGLGLDFQAPPVTKARQVLLGATTPRLGEHPVGSGVLVASRDAIRAKALTHYSAKWPWAARDGVEVLRLSYPEHVFPTRAEVLADASRLTGTTIADDEAVALASVGWDAMPSRIDPANRDYLVGIAAEVGVDLMGAWVDGNGIGSVIAGTARIAL